jgi:RNA polymerase sigma factor (sigma-70 family)
MPEATKQQPCSEDVLLSVYRSLVRYWISRQMSSDKAEDLAQEGILKCLQKAGKWQRKNNASLETFLITVGKNAGRDVVRKEARRERIMQQSSETDETPDDDL